MQAVYVYLRACAAILGEACTTLSPFSTQSLGQRITSQLCILASRSQFLLKISNKGYGIYSSSDICIWSLLSLTIMMIIFSQNENQRTVKQNYV